MTKAKIEVDNKDYYKDVYFLYEILGSLKSVDEVKSFAKDIFTKSELRMLKKRWYIANLLSQNYDIRTIANRSRASTQTVSKIKHVLEEGYGGLRLALQRISVIVSQNDKMKSKKPKGHKYVRGWLR